MRENIYRALAGILCLGILFVLLSGRPAWAAQAENDTEEQDAEDISSHHTITHNIGLVEDTLFDDQKHFGCIAEGGAQFTAGHEKGIGSIYIIFQYEYGPYEVTNNDTGETTTVGHERFIHQFLDMQELFGSCPKSVTVRLEEGPVAINDLKIFTPGKVPDYVQKWKLPKENETDLILFSTHADDEHLFFAGLLPYYGAELDYEVLVVYLTGHQNFNLIRTHELLNGLWAVGIDTYPIIGTFTDFRKPTVQETYACFKQFGETKEMILEYVVEQVRRFKPKVVVAHDFAGEYGHGQHMVYAEVVAEALEITSDPALYPELAEKYGVWDIPKAYFHLYEENEIILDWDRPLSRFGGETAFEVSIYRGFQMHESQVEAFRWYYAGFPDAKSLPEYNPCYFGLYRSTVGPDTEKNDFFENVTTYEQDRLAEEARQSAQTQTQPKAEEDVTPTPGEQSHREMRKHMETQTAGTPIPGKNAQTTVLIIMAVLAAGCALLGCLRRKKKKR